MDRDIEDLKRLSDFTISIDFFIFSPIVFNIYFVFVFLCELITAVSSVYHAQHPLVLLFSHHCFCAHLVQLQTFDIVHCIY